MTKKKKDENALEVIKTQRKKKEIASRENTDIILIESILNSATEKLRLMFCLELLTADECEALSKMIPEGELHTFTSILDSLKSLKSTILNEVDENIIFYTYNDENLEILFNWYVARPDEERSNEDKVFEGAVEDLLARPKVLRACQLLQGKISPEASYFLETMKKIKHCLINRMKTGPNREFQREKELSDMFIYNDWAKDEIAVLSRKFTLAMDKQANRIADKCAQANQINKRIDQVVLHGREMTKFFGRIADNKIIWQQKKSEYIQDNLSGEVRSLEATYDTLLSSHLAKEKFLRVRRSKTEAQLLSVLRKYDSDVKERDKIFTELTQLFNEEQQQLKELQAQFEKQATEYHALMDEKEEYEFHIWEQKLLAVQKNVAARKIQRYYRAYVSLCLASGYSRLKKKGKGKGKAKKKK